MRHHRRHLGFVVRRLDGPQIDIHRTAGHGESVDFFLVHHMEVVRPLFSRSVAGQIGAQPLYVLRDGVRLAQQRKLLVSLSRCLLPRLHLFLRGKQVKAVRRLHPRIYKLRRSQTPYQQGRQALIEKALKQSWVLLS